VTSAPCHEVLVQVVSNDLVADDKDIKNDKMECIWLEGRLGRCFISSDKSISFNQVSRSWGLVSYKKSKKFGVLD
jgi:hypothetical protein